jgi:hypothetical protein
MLRRLWKRLNEGKYASFAQLSQQGAGKKEIIITESTVCTANLEDVSILVDEKAVFVNQGNIKGTLVSKGGKVIIYGQFEGYLHSLGLLHIKKESVISADVICSELIVSPGGKMDGTFTFSSPSQEVSIDIEPLSQRERDWLERV